MLTKTKARTNRYPKPGKPHIFKDENGWNVVWIPGTVIESKLKKSFEFVNSRK